MLNILLEGIVLGFSIAAPVGVIGALCIQQTLRGGFVAGLSTGLGAATADMLYGILAVFGLAMAKRWLIPYQEYLLLFGGLFLCYLGTKIFLSPAGKVQSGGVEKINLVGAYLRTFFLTLANPMTILAFVAMISGLNILNITWHESLLFVAGVFFGSAIWWIILSGVAASLRKKISESALSLVNKISGVIIILFGIKNLFLLLN